MNMHDFKKIIFTLPLLLLSACGNEQSLNQGLANAIGQNNNSRAVFNLTCFRDHTGRINKIRFTIVDDLSSNPATFSYIDDKNSMDRSKVITCTKTSCKSPAYGHVWNSDYDYYGSIDKNGKYFDAEIITDQYNKPSEFSIEGTSCP